MQVGSRRTWPGSIPGASTRGGGWSPCPGCLCSLGRWTGRDAASPTLLRVADRTSIHLLVQLPFVDLRPLMREPTGRLKKPTWPTGRVSATPGSGEFVRGFGELCRTRPRDTGGWEGRAQHVRAHGALRFPPEAGAWLTQRLRTTGRFWPPARVRCTGRALYGSAISPRWFLQFDFELDIAGRLQHVDRLVELARAGASIPVRIPSSPQERVALVSAGPPLARFIRECSTANNFSQEHPERLPTWWFESLRPMVAVDAATPEVAESRSQLREILHDDHGALHYCYVEGSLGYDLWLALQTCDVSLPAYSSRQARLHLSRFHSERVAMMAIARALATERLGKAEVLEAQAAWDELQQTLIHGFGFLHRDHAFGRDQRAMMGALQADLVMNAAEWDVLRSVVAKMRPAVSAHMEAIFKYVQGDQVMGDKFENISNSSIVNRSSVVESFNAIREASEIDLVEAMAAVGEQVERSGSPEAAEAFEELAQEMAKERRKPVLKALWYKVKDLAPGVTAIATAVAAIEKVFL